MCKKISLEKNFLYKEFIVKGKNVTQIALENNISRTTISRELNIKLSIKNTKKVRGKFLYRTIGHLFVEDFDVKKLSWKCKCECGKICYRNSANLRLSTQNSSCGCESWPKRRKSPHWRGYEDVPLSFWSRFKKGARERNIIFNISTKDIWEVYIKQDKRCIYTGEHLVFQTKNDCKSGNASLDRIDSKKGYTVANIQLVVKKINIMKMGEKSSEFVEIADNIVNYEKEKSMSVNQIILSGHLTRDPETKDVGDKKVSKFGLAVNRNYGENEVDFFDIEAWGPSQVCTEKFLVKGKEVTVIGSVRQDRWEDKEGKSRSKVFVRADNIQLHGKKDSDKADKPAKTKAEKPAEDVPF